MKIRYTKVTVFVSVKLSNGEIATEEYDASGVDYKMFVGAIKHKIDARGDKFIGALRESVRDEIDVPLGYILNYKDESVSDAVKEGN